LAGTGEAGWHLPLSEIQNVETLNEQTQEHHVRFVDAFKPYVNERQSDFWTSHEIQTFFKVLNCAAV
jgi:hypothetical protein